MRRISFFALLIVASVLASPPASAQWGTIFGGNEPPRPPGSVPRQDFPPNQPLPPGAPPPGSRGGAIQSQPLPPPPGGNVPLDTRQPRTQQSTQTPPGQQLPGLPPGQRQPRPAPPPAEEGLIEPTTAKITNPTAVFSGLDKITGRIITFPVAINETVRFGALEVTPRVCYTRPPTETANTDGFVEVDELTLQGELRRIFTGWMFAASPGLNAVEHPIYDIWLADCKGGAPPVAEAPEVQPPPRQQPQRQQQQQPRRATAPPQQLPPPPRGF